MNSLEQLKELEAAIDKAVAFIGKLKDSNKALRRSAAKAEEKSRELEAKLASVEAESEAARARLSEAEQRLIEVESSLAETSTRYEDFRKQQVLLEEGIVHALEKLESFSDILFSKNQSKEAAEEQVQHGAELDIF